MKSFKLQAMLKSTHINACIIKKYNILAYQTVMNRVWLIEFEDNWTSKNREEIRTEY